VQGGAVLRGVDGFARRHAAQETGEAARLGQADEQRDRLRVDALLGKVGEQFAAAEAEAREALRVVDEKLVQMPPRQRVAPGGEGLPFRGLGERRHDLA
jgi:hypothetical protein